MSQPLSFVHLDACSSLEELNQFVTEYTKEKKINARQAERIEDKVASLYQKALKEKNDSTPYVETLSVVFTLKKACSENSPTIFEKIFGQNKKLEEIEKDCLRHIRADRTLMAQITQNYDSIAGQINQAMEQSNWQELKSVYLPKYEQLEFLNQILGLPWSKAQKTGERPVPRWLEDMMIFVPVSVKNPKECETIEELLGMVGYINNNKEEPFHKLDASAKKLMIENMAKRLKELYAHSLKQSTYSHVPVSWQTYACIFQLNEICQTIKSDRTAKKDIQNILENCLSEIRQDTKRMRLLIPEWNKLALDWNQTTFHHYAKNRVDVDQKPYESVFWIGKYNEEKVLVKFIAPILAYQISEAQLNKRALLPICPTKFSAKNIVLQHTYNKYAMLINHEMPLRNQWKALDHLRYQLTHPFVSATLPGDRKAQLNDQMRRQEAMLACTASPLPEEMLQTLLEGIQWMSDILSIQLTKEQLEGKIPLPIFGAEGPVKLPERPEVRKIQLPHLWQIFNDNVAMINQYMEWREKKQQLLYLESQLSLSVYDESIQLVKKLRADVAALEKEALLVGYERWFLDKLSMILYINHLCQFVSLDDMQKAGIKPWPFASAEALGRPPDEAELLKDLENAKGEEIEMWTRAWPENWKTEISVVLEQLREKIRSGTLSP